MQRVGFSYKLANALQLHMDLLFASLGTARISASLLVML